MFSKLEPCPTRYVEFNTETQFELGHLYKLPYNLVLIYLVNDRI